MDRVAASNRRQATLLGWVILGSILGGCAGPDAPASHGEDLPIITEVVSRDQRWFWMEAEAKPEGALTSFNWTLPPDAIIETQSGRKALTLEVVPLSGNLSRPDIDDWALFAFVTLGGRARLWSTALNPTYEFTPSDVPPSGTVTRKANVDPFYFYLSLEAWQMEGYSFGRTEFPFQAGDNISFIVAARAQEPDSFSVAFRPLDFSIQTSLDGSQLTTKDFVKSLPKVQRIPLPRVAAASGFHLGVWADGAANWQLEAGEYRSPNVEVSSPTPPTPYPVSEYVDLTISTHTDLAGFSFATAYLDTYNGIGEWNADLDLHGAELHEEAIFLMPALYGASAWQLLLGVPGYEMVQQGAGGAQSRLRLTGLEASGGFLHNYWFVHATLGANVTDLLGVPEILAVSKVRGTLPTALAIGVDGAMLLATADQLTTIRI